jgi:hypothetical protein
MMKQPQALSSLQGRLLALCLLGLALLAGLLTDMHPHFDVESFPAFHAALGLAAAVLLIGGVALLGRVLGRRRDYYDRHD